jgi:DNA primase
MSEVIRRQRIIEKMSIAAVVAEYLQPRDGSRLQSLCPFQNDQLGTLSLDPVARSFTGFACGATGDVVDFVRTFEGLTDSQALDMLESRPKA